MEYPLHVGTSRTKTYEDGILKKLTELHERSLEIPAYRERIRRGLNRPLPPDELERHMLDLATTDGLYKSFNLNGIPFPEDNPKGFVEWLNLIMHKKIDPNKFDGKYSRLQELINDIENEGVYLATSSGTGGKLTFIPRDEETVKRAKYSYSQHAKETVLPGEDLDEWYFIAAMPEKTVIYIANGGRWTAEELFPGRYKFVMPDVDADTLRKKMGNYKTRVEKLFGPLIAPVLIEKLKKKTAEKLIEAFEEYEGKKVVLFCNGPQLYKILEIVEKKGYYPKFNGLIIATGGGNKGINVTDKEVEREFREYFGKHNDFKRADVYGMAEINSAFMSLQEPGDVEVNGIRNRHAPPWIYVRVVDPYTMKIKPHKGKQRGLLLVGDPLHTNVSPFFLVGDEVEVNFDPDEKVGITTPRVDVLGRLEMDTRFGCARELSLER